MKIDYDRLHTNYLSKMGIQSGRTFDMLFEAIKLSKPETEAKSIEDWDDQFGTPRVAYIVGGSEQHLNHLVNMMIKIAEALDLTPQRTHKRRIKINNMIYWFQTTTQTKSLSADVFIDHSSLHANRLYRILRAQALPDFF